MAIQANVASPDDVQQLFDKTLKAYGQIDVVVNNAGIMPMSLLTAASHVQVAGERRSQPI